jgi:hypothetical protein
MAHLVRAGILPAVESANQEQSTLISAEVQGSSSLRRVEAKVAVRLADRQFRTAYEGAFGKSVRAILIEEERFVASWMNQQNTAAMLTLLAGVGSGLGGGSFTPPVMFQIAEELDRSLQKMTASFADQSQTAITEQVVEVVRLGSVERQLRVSSIADLRRDMKQIYDRVFYPKAPTKPSDERRKRQS